MISEEFFYDWKVAWEALSARKRDFWRRRCSGQSDEVVAADLSVTTNHLNVASYRSAAECLPEHDGMSRSRLMCYLIGRNDG